MKKNLKITHVINGRCGKQNTSGVYESVYNFVIHQSKLGHAVRLICVTNKDIEIIEGVEVIKVRRPCIPLMGSEELENSIVSNQPDVVHVHSAYVPINIVVGRIARSNKIPYVVTPHGNASPSLLKRRPYIKYPYKFLFEKPLLNSALFIHTIADSDDVLKYGVKRPMVKAINGIDCPFDYKAKPSKPGISKYNVNTDCKIFLYLGRLDIEQKGLDLLLKGFSLAYKSNPKIRLVMAGSDWGGSRALLEALVSELELDSAVTFTGAVYGADKHRLFRDCDFFVHSSRWEAGVPFSVLEALSYGKKVLVTKEVDREGLLKHNKVANIAELSRESIAKELCLLLSMSENNVTQVREDARALMEINFSWEKSARDLIEGYILHLK